MSKRKATTVKEDHAALEELRKRKDRAAAAGDQAKYNRLRDLVDLCITILQSKGSLGTLDLETLAGPEED